MKAKFVAVLFVMGLIARGHAQQCYVCYDCPDGKNLPESYLMSCSEEETTTASQPTTTTVQTVEPPVETISPTNPPVESTTLQTTPTSVQSTEPPTEPPTEPATQTTNQPSAEPSTEPTTLETTPESQTTTAQSSFTTVPIPESPISTTSAAPATESSIGSTEITTATVPSGPPSTTDRPTGTPPSRRRNLVKQAAYNCYVLVNATNHVNRGCVAASNYPNDMCRVANGLVLPLECRVCETDKCNSSSRIVVSVFLFVLSISSVLSL